MDIFKNPMGKYCPYFIDLKRKIGSWHLISVQTYLAYEEQNYLSLLVSKALFINKLK